MPVSSAHRRINQTGLIILAATLLAVLAVVLISDRYGVAQRSADLQERSVALARALMSQTAGGASATVDASGMLLQQQLQDPAFVTGALFDGEGAVRLQVPAAAQAPVAADVSDPASWLIPQAATAIDGRRLFRFAGRDRAGRQFQFAVRAPESRLGLANLQYLALLSLPVLLLMALFLVLLRRDVRPISTLSELLDAFERERQLGVLSAGADGINDVFLRKFTRFVAYVQARIDKSNAISSKLITNERLANYRMARLESVLQALPDGLIWLDDNARVLTANRRALQILGVDPDEYRLLPLREFSAHPQLREYFAHLEQRGARNLESIEVELPAPAPACLSLSAHPVSQPSAEQTLIGTVVLLRDATSESLAKRSRSEFIANVAHELKSPLNTLRLYADSLVDDGEDREIRLEATTVIQDEVDRLASLINNLLNITQIETGSLQVRSQRTQLQTMLEDIVTTMGRSDAARALKITLQMPAEVPAISVDKELLRIALNNLLSNAIKYSDPGGQIVVSVQDGAEALSISVSDGGIGIDAAEQERIFDKFYRAADPEAVRRGGHGLGLALCKEIVQLHHGTLRLDSTPGEGSVFTIDLFKHSGLIQEAIA